MIQFWNVSKKYPAGPTALADVSFSIARGEFVFLTGPSGAGKTTLLKLIYREELPDSGQIVVNGRNLTALRRRKIPYLRRSIGVVFQSFRLIARKTVFENVTYLPRILGMSRAEQQRMCERALRRVGLAHRLNAYPRQLSGGEQQRVTLARALVCDPRIILADEPTGNLDPELSAEILALLREIHAQGTTVIVATHDRAIIESLGGRVLLLHRGRLVADGYRAPVAVVPPPYAAAVAAAIAEGAARRARADDVRRRHAEGALRFFQALSYFVTEAFVSLARSWKVSVAAIAAIGVSLFLCGAFLVLFRNLSRTVEQWQQEVAVVVYLPRDVERAQVEDLRFVLDAPLWVRGIVEVDAAAAARRFEETFPRLAELARTGEGDLFPPSLEAEVDPGGHRRRAVRAMDRRRARCIPRR